MNVISSSLVLNPPPDAALDAPIIGWDNIVTPDNVSSNQEAANHPATNVANPSTSLEWRATSAGIRWLITISDGFRPLDYVAVARHNLGTAQTPISVQRGEFNEQTETFTWITIVSEFIPADDSPILIRFPKEPYEGIRFRMGEGNAAPRVACMYVGELMAFPNGVDVGFTPLPFGRVTNVATGMTETGNFNGRVIKGRQLRSQVNFSALPADWVREVLAPFIDFSVGDPFFFAWAPQEQPGEVAYAWVEQDITPLFEEGGLCRVSIAMGGLAPGLT